MTATRISILDRGRMEMDRNLLVEASVTSTERNPNPEFRRTTVPIISLIIDHPDATILWDTGSHHEAGDGHWPEWLFDLGYQPDAGDHRLDDDLNDAGYALSDIDAVVMSHLHLDHAGGLEFFSGTDVPVYSMPTNCRMHGTR